MTQQHTRLEIAASEMRAADKARDKAIAKAARLEYESKSANTEVQKANRAWQEALRNLRHAEESA